MQIYKNLLCEEAFVSKVQTELKDLISQTQIPEIS
jgi:hypothetical protein